MTRQYRTYTKEDAADIYEVYKDINIPVSQVAKQFNIKAESIARVLKRFKYPVRPKGFRPGNCAGIVGVDLVRRKILWIKKFTYMRRAKKKGLDFTLTDDQFIDMVTSNCHYCGKSHTKEERVLSNGKKVNILSIDRVDSSKGYVLPNCVPSCKVCNTMKMDLKYDAFIDQMKTILKHLKVD